jgi:UDP-2,3-diacylglucosamine pyrophosphatase LpxH
MINYDAIIISDLHLGSKVCQAKQLIKFLSKIEKAEIKLKQLILNGDVFDSWNFRRLCKTQWKVLSLLRKISGFAQVVWLNGNHDGPAELISPLLGIQVLDEYVLESGQNKILVLHGHIFDNVISKHPLLVSLADQIYRFLQKIHIRWARNVKKYSKTFMRCSEQIERKSKEYAKKKGCNIVCVGHTHLDKVSIGEVSYFNSGCWTEIPCSYLTICDGEVNLYHL